MRVLISGGGTGGHVYPALAVSDQLVPQAAAHQGALQPAVLPAPKIASNPPDDPGQEHSVLWIGSTGGMEQELVERAGLPYRGVDTGQLRGKGPLTALKNAGKMIHGIQQSSTILSEFLPDVCLVTGGYVCAPVVTACRKQRVPVLIYLPDMVPGWAIQLMSRFAQRVAVSFPDAAQHFGGEMPVGKAVVTGYPVRAALVRAASDREQARQELAAALDMPLITQSHTDLPLLLVSGGSQGSRSINQALWGALSQLVPYAHILHVVGKRDWDMAQSHIHRLVAAADVPPKLLEHYHPVDYLHEAMPLALAAADLAIARAGASVLGEFPVAGLPSILVPLPFAGSNQLVNAQQLANCGAAVIVEDGKLAEELGPTVVDLLCDENRRAHMAIAAAELSCPAAATNIVEQLIQLAEAER